MWSNAPFQFYILHLQDSCWGINLCQNGLRTYDGGGLEPQVLSPIGKGWLTYFGQGLETVNTHPVSANTLLMAFNADICHQLHNWA